MVDDGVGAPKASPIAFGRRFRFRDEQGRGRIPFIRLTAAMS
jgi:hypothetical protein